MLDKVALAACIAGSIGCQTVNIHGHTVDTSRATFSHHGRELTWFEGRPRGVTSLPTVVFLEGDGSQCQAFDEGLWTRFLTRFTGRHRLVRPRTFINTICDTPAFAKADFAHRHDETDALVAALFDRYADAPLFLMGSSAGARLALHHAEGHPGRVRGIVNLGGGYLELSLLLPAIAEAKGTSPEETAELLGAIADVRTQGPNEEPFWGRTRAFWHQMFFSDELARWQRHRGPVLVVHGKRDLDSVPFTTVREAHATMSDNIELHVVDGAGHDVMQADVMKRVDRWITNHAQ